MMRYILVPMIAAVSTILPAQSIPTSIVNEINAAPTKDAITLQSGKEYKAPVVLKVRNLTLTPGAKLVFPQQVGYTTYILAVTNLYVQVATPGEDSPLISYTRTRPYKRVSDCFPPPATGQRGNLNHPNGYPGGPGVFASGNGNAATRPPFKVYIVVNNVVTRGGTPSGARLVNLDFNGLDGDDGADGCPGGRGGDGLDAGSFQDAGDSGVPGPGSRGGNAAPGQGGAEVHWYAAKALKDIIPFFIATVEGGAPGRPGAGGICGPTGTAGSGQGFKKGGRGIDCSGPRISPAGDKGAPGVRGSLTTALGDYTAVLPSLIAPQRRR